MYRNISLTVVALIALLGCQQTPATTQTNTNACDNQAFSVDKAFEQGRFSQCKRVAENKVILSLVPEDKPINDSPWYAFRVTAKQQLQLIVELDYTFSKHRYKPKISADGKNWQLLNKDSVWSSKDRKKARFTLNLDKGSYFIAGQPLMDNKSYEIWLNDFQPSKAVSTEIIGRTPQDRAIWMLQNKAAEEAPYLVFLGRQHPPEITGAIAMRAFVDRIFADEPLANAFRQQFNLLIYPNVNPDGVALGNWRHNTRGKDLNRDWGPFTQPETRQINASVEQLSQGNIWGVVDFHSTWRDIFYTQKASQPIRFPKFTAAWLKRINEQSKVIKFEPRPGHSPDKPTSKTFFYEKYKIPAITYEIGDNSDPQAIVDVGELSAETYMQQLLMRKQK